MTPKEQKELAESIFTDRGFDAREYTISNIIGNNLNPCLPLVTAVGTSGGKTFETAARFEFLYSNGFIKPNHRVLILAAEKKILRSNMFTQFESFFSKKDASFSYCSVSNKKELIKAIDGGIQVIITLPQTVCGEEKLELLSGCDFEWIVQDEAHKWYFARTTRSIIEAIQPKHQSLLTGTPFKFNKENRKSTENRFIINYTSVRELYELGYLSDVKSYVLHSDVKLTDLDYVNMLGNLKDTKSINKNETIKTFNTVMEQIIKKLKLPFKGLSSVHNITKNAASIFGTLGQTIIFTHNIEAANYVYAHINKMGINSLISHSNLPSDSNEIFNLFKEDKKYKILVLVNQGIEGFDKKDLYHIIDMSYTRNFSVGMQMFGRVLRKNPNIPVKHFFKVAPKNMHGFVKDWMDAMFMLFDEEWYSRFDGSNGFDIEIPVKARTNRNRGPRGPRGPRGQRTPSTKMINLDNFNSLSFMTDNAWFKIDDKLSTVATTTLRKVCAIHNAVTPIEDLKKLLIKGTESESSKPNYEKTIIDPVEYAKRIKEEKEEKERKLKKRGMSIQELKKLLIK